MSFFEGPRPKKFENWVCVLERGTEYEIAMARNYLSHLRIPSNILSSRDSSFNLNIGETSMVYLYVPNEYEKRARKALEELDDIELEEGWDEDLPDTDDEFWKEPGDPGRGEEGPDPERNDPEDDREGS